MSSEVLVRPHPAAEELHVLVEAYKWLVTADYLRSEYEPAIPGTPHVIEQVAQTGVGFDGQSEDMLPTGIYFGRREVRYPRGNIQPTSVVSLYDRRDLDSITDQLPEQLKEDDTGFVLDQKALEQRPTEQIKRMGRNARVVLNYYGVTVEPLVTEQPAYEKPVPEESGPELVGRRSVNRFLQVALIPIV